MLKPDGMHFLDICACLLELPLSIEYADTDNQVLYAQRLQVADTELDVETHLTGTRGRSGGISRLVLFITNFIKTDLSNSNQQLDSV